MKPSQVLMALLALLASSSAFADNPFDFSDFSKFAKNGLGWNADILRMSSSFADNPALREATDNPAYSAVTNEFGPTLINLRDLPINSTLAAADSEAWSSWWFPKFEDTLFKPSNSDYSPLEKYDQVRGRGPQAAAWEEQNEYNPTAARWEGLCDAWSLAAITYPEPKRAVRIRNVNFTPGDIKALVLKTFESIDESALKIYGMRFEGNRKSYIHPDIFPDQFHRFIEVQLFRNKKGFIMDHDPGVPVWTVPVYKANYKMEQDRSDPNQVNVRMWLFNAAQLTTADDWRSFVGSRVEVREYDYILRGERNAQGQLVVKSGMWVKGPMVDSRDDHPDYLVTVPNTGALRRDSRNPSIDAGAVDAIAKDSF